MRCEQVHSLYVLHSGASVSLSGFASTDEPQAEFEIAPINCLLLKLPGCESGEIFIKVIANINLQSCKDFNVTTGEVQHNQ